MLAHYHITSHFLNNTRAVWHLAPPDEVVSDRTPCCVLLDGEYYVERMDASALIQELWASGELPVCHMLFVSHHSGEARHRECCCNPDFTAFLCKELHPWAEETLGLGRSGQAHTLGGLSLTGLAAAYAALCAPEQFDRVLAQSASFWWSQEWLIDQFERTPQLPVRFYISCGQEETDERIEHGPGLYQIRSQLAVNRRMRATLLQAGYDVSYREFKSGHNVQAWKADLPQGLKALLVG
jgi:enterochelin esterase-like enzyme